MNRFSELLRSVSARPATVVHIGAGSCQEFSCYQQIGATRFVLVEPNDALAEQLAGRLANVDNVTIDKCAVAEETGRRRLGIFNNWRLSSLLEPGDALFSYYPNVEAVEEKEVPVKTLGELVQGLQLDDSSRHLLVAELQGMENLVFATTDGQTLGNFNWILVRTSEPGLYQSDGQSDPAKLIQALEDNDFTVLVFNEKVPPFLNLLCIRNRPDETGKLHEICAKQEARILERERQLAEQSDLLGKLNQLVRNLKEKNLDQARDISALSAERDEFHAQAEELGKLMNESDDLPSDLVNSLQDKTLKILKASVDLAELQARYETLAQAYEHQQQLLGELRSKLKLAIDFYRQAESHDRGAEGGGVPDEQ